MDKKSRQQAKENVIEVLNKARAMELHAISQYMNQHYNLDDMDYGELAAKMKLIAIDEMRHAEQFAERIKELGGEPTTDLAQKVLRGQEVDKIYTFDTDLEEDALADYNAFLEVCRQSGDSTSMKLLESIIDEEQMHLNYFQNVDGHLKKLGAAYLARIAGTPAETGPQNPGFVGQNGGAA
jgi:bacterioferritin